MIQSTGGVKTSVELASVPITREGLLTLQKRKSLALAVLDLLNRDLEVLVKEFFRLIKEVEDARWRLYENRRETYRHYAEAGMVLGTRRVRQLALTIVEEDVLKVKVKEKRMVGIRLLNVLIPSVEPIEKPTALLNYNLLDTSAVVEDMVTRVRDSLGIIVRVIEAEAALDAIAQAMGITKRRINIIQYRIIPSIDRMIRYIESILEERAREDAIRIRILQRKRKVRSAATAS
ncbi:MAG: V-type ATP synthase subunit D [Candidatus Bathyarchaeia archaeon]